MTYHRPRYPRPVRAADADGWCTCACCTAKDNRCCEVRERDNPLEYVVYDAGQMLNPWRMIPQ